MGDGYEVYVCSGSGALGGFPPLRRVYVGIVLYGDVWICVCESVRAQCVVARGWPAAFDGDDDDDESRQVCINRERDDMNAWSRGGVYIALYFRRLRTRNLPDITKEQTPVVWRRGVRGAQREARRNGGCLCPIRVSSRSERDEIQNRSSISHHNSKDVAQLTGLILFFFVTLIIIS